MYILIINFSLGYVVEKRPLAGKGSRWTKIVTLDGTMNSHVIENLKESEFLFRVFAENSLGLSLPTTSEPVLLKSHASKITNSFVNFVNIILQITAFV